MPFDYDQAQSFCWSGDGVLKVYCLQQSPNTNSLRERELRSIAQQTEISCRYTPGIASPGIILSYIILYMPRVKCYVFIETRLIRVNLSRHLFIKFYSLRLGGTPITTYHTPVQFFYTYWQTAAPQCVVSVLQYACFLYKLK